MEKSGLEMKMKMEKSWPRSLCSNRWEQPQRGRRSWWEQGGREKKRGRHRSPQSPDYTDENRIGRSLIHVLRRKVDKYELKCCARGPGFYTVAELMKRMPGWSLEDGNIVAEQIHAFRTDDHFHTSTCPDTGDVCFKVVNKEAGQYGVNTNE